MRPVPTALILFACAFLFYTVFEPVPKVRMYSESIGSLLGTFTSARTTDKEPDDTILFTGDLMFARSVERTMDAYGAHYPLEKISELFQKHTYVVANFEASVPKEHIQTKDLTYTFSVDTKYLSSLRDAHITHVSLANNHSYDFGYADFLHTKESLLHNDVQSFGKPYTFSTSSYTTITYNSQPIALVGIDVTLRTYTKDEVTTLFEDASSETDTQIALVHWGNEYTPHHSKKQEEFAKVLIEAGADLIIGHHPHVVQDIQVYDDVFVLYSLGNFVFDQYFSTDVQEGLLVSVTAIDPIALTLIPVSSIGSRNQPRVMSQLERDTFLKTLAKKSAPVLRDAIVQGSVIQ